MERLKPGMHRAAFFCFGVGQKKIFWCGAGCTIPRRGGVTVKLGAFLGWGGAGQFRNFRGRGDRDIHFPRGRSCYILLNVMKNLVSNNGNFSEAKGRLHLSLELQNTGFWYSLLQCAMRVRKLAILKKIGEVIFRDNSTLSISLSHLLNDCWNASILY